MTYPVYPASLPLPLQSSYSETYAPAVMRTQFLDGTARQRVYPSNVSDTVVNATIQMTDSQYATWFAFYSNDIRYGTDWFTMSLPSNSGQLVSRIVRLQSGKFRKSLVHRNSAGCLWKISVTLDMRDMSYDS